MSPETNKMDSQKLFVRGWRAGAFEHHRTEKEEMFSYSSGSTTLIKSMRGAEE